MATEHRAIIAAALMATLAGGCDPVVNRCQAGTLLVTVSLDSGSLVADELDVALSLDGGSALESTLSHTPGKALGNLVVTFPRGYPSGSVVAVVVTARAGGVAVGVGRALATLSGSCQATTLAIAAASDDAGDEADLADTDAAPAGAADLSLIDLSTAMAPPADLGPPPPDLFCPGGGTELCFNGVDDDCDGLADCADPDCAPVAVCVPSASAPFAYGTQEPAGGSCPAATNSATRYQYDATGGGCASTCNCNASGCSATMQSIIPCPGGTPQSTIGTLTHSCTNIEDVINFRIGAVGGTLSCGLSGSAAPVTPPALPTSLGCTMASTVTQGGCLSGQVCVARGTKQCVSTAGASASCPSGYPNGATWYASYNDSRTCSCSCGNSGCGAAGVSFFDSKSCSGTAQPKSGDICSNGLLGAKLVGGCTLSVTFANPLTFNNASTVCCQ